MAFDYDSWLEKPYQDYYEDCDREEAEIERQSEESTQVHISIDFTVECPHCGSVVAIDEVNKDEPLGKLMKALQTFMTPKKSILEDEYMQCDSCNKYFSFSGFGFDNA